MNNDYYPEYYISFVFSKKYRFPRQLIIRAV